MDVYTWIAFAGASLALLAVPGPVVMLLIGYTLGHGGRVAAAAVPGVVLGDFVAMSVSLLGAGAVLAASAEMFLALKLAGAAYLVWLGISTWRGAEGGVCVAAPDGRHGWRALRDAFLVTAFNPKDIVFFVAFLPQFIAPDRPLVPQIVLLEATFLTLVVISNGLWILLAASVSRQLRKPTRFRAVNRIGASCLVGAGAMTALSR